MNRSKSVSRFDIPSEKIIRPEMDERVGAARFMLLKDGTCVEYKDEMEDGLNLMHWEYILTSRYFNELKKESRDLAATAPSYSGGDYPQGTIPDYSDKYKDVTYKDYLKQRSEDLESDGVRDRFDKNYRLIDRPAERIKICLEYIVDDYDLRKLDNDQLAKCYKLGLDKINNTPEMRDYVLASLNLDSYKTGLEAKEIDIFVFEKSGNEVEISVSIVSVKGYQGGIKEKFKTQV